ncbi:uncharacterized protein [Drosophila tropicalis]|uniref:uncharacterized protein n=1 Tax=Drosophila tropicalis TaxID=46794 RepID=UPI0035ABEC6D
MKFITNFVLMLLLTLREIAGHVEFTNVVCNSFDKSFADFEYCHIKAVNRSYKYVSLKVNLYKVPVTKIKVNLALWKRYNGYKPFLYNVTVDACKFLANPAKNPIANFLFGSFLPYTNANHLCPFNESIILDKLPIDFLNHYLTKVLPFPLGDYGGFSNWYAYDVNRASVKLYATLS